MATPRGKTPAAAPSDNDRAGILALKMVCRLAVYVAPGPGPATFRQIVTAVYPLVSHAEVDEIEQILARAYPGT